MSNVPRGTIILFKPSVFIIAGGLLFKWSVFGEVYVIYAKRNT